MKKGIDLHKALEILGERSKDEGHHPHHHDYGSENTRGCQHNAPEEAKNWGQTIDLGADKVAEVLKTEEDLRKQKQDLEEARMKRRCHLQELIDGMNFKQLLEHVFRNQEQRVATYRAYDRGLAEVLKTGNLSRYPTICAEATASFSVISESINHARTAMEKKYKNPAIAELVGRLQQAEKEKLNYTAALHLEQLRSQAHLSTEEDQANGQSSAAISSMILQDVRSLKQKIGVTVETVNEVLDELRDAMTDIAE